MLWLSGLVRKVARKKCDEQREEKKSFLQESRISPITGPTSVFARRLNLILYQQYLPTSTASVKPSPNAAEIIVRAHASNGLMAPVSRLTEDKRDEPLDDAFEQRSVITQTIERAAAQNLR